MSDAAPPRDTTFRSFNNQQGRNYAKHRSGYHPRLYEVLIDRYTSTGGQFNTILDVGCGPGTAITKLAPQFAHAIAIDPSEGMISNARSLSDVSSDSGPIRFEISTAEELGSNLSPPIPDGSVDLIIAATAAHWFDMSGFWPRAAQVLKPGGTVALWTSGQARFSPSMPGSAALQAALDTLHEHLTDYMIPSNRLNHELYVDLPMPWTLASPVLEFDKTTFFRRDWGMGGDSEPGDQFFAINQPPDLNTLELMLGTASPVIKWREAHPDMVGSERDVVKIMRREMEQALEEAGVEKGKEILTGGVAGVLLMLKKKA